MKTHKLILFLTFLCLLGSVAGCGAKTAPAGDGFEIFIQNDTGVDLAEIQIDFSLGEGTLGSAAGCHADGTPMKPGETMDFELLREYFPENADLSLLQIQVTARNAEGLETEAHFPVKIDAAYGNSYQISLTGNAEDGYDAQRIS